MVDLTINTDVARQILTGFIRSEVTRVGFSHAVVGLSGGIDSSAVCCLAARHVERLAALSEGRVLERVTFRHPFYEREVPVVAPLVLGVSAITKIADLWTPEIIQQAITEPVVERAAFIDSGVVATSSRRACSQSSGLIDQLMSERTQVGSLGSVTPTSQRTLGTMRSMMAWVAAGLAASAIMTMQRVAD